MSRREETDPPALSAKSLSLSRIYTDPFPLSFRLRSTAVLLSSVTDETESERKKS